MKGPSAEPITIIPAAKDFMRPKWDVPKHSAQKAFGIILFEPAVTANKISPIENPITVSQIENM